MYNEHFHDKFNANNIFFIFNIVTYIVHRDREFTNESIYEYENLAFLMFDVLLNPN